MKYSLVLVLLCASCTKQRAPETFTCENRQGDVVYDMVVQKAFTHDRNTWHLTINYEKFVHYIQQPNEICYVEEVR